MIEQSEAALKAVQKFTERFRAMDERRQPHFDRWEENEKLFRSHLETADKESWQSTLFIPRTYGVVMSSLAEFAINKPDISVEPDTKVDAIRVPYMKSVMESNWRTNKGNGEFLFGVLDSFKLGTGIFEVGYRKTERTIKKIKDYDPLTEKITWEEDKLIDEDDVYFEAVNPRYVWFDDSADSIKTAADSIREYTYSEEAFHSIFDGKFKKAEDIVGGTNYVDQNQEFFKDTDLPMVKVNEVRVFCYTNKLDDVRWWIANGVLLNEPDDPIPFKHKRLNYAILTPTPYDKYSLYGPGLPELIEDLQNEINNLRNMGMDQLHLNIFAPFLYSSEEDIDEKIFSIEPGVGIPVADAKNFNFFKQPSAGQDFYANVSKLDDDVSQTIGFDQRLQGLPGGGTATEQAILKETALKRINLYLRFIEEFNMPDFAELWGDTIQQFYFMSSKTKTKKKKSIGGNEREEIFRSIKIPKVDAVQFSGIASVGDFNFLDVTENDIVGKFGFNVKIGTSISISKELDKQSKLRLYSMFANDPTMNVNKFKRDVLLAFDRDPEEYMNIKPQVDVDQSIALASQHNRDMVAGDIPKINRLLITPEHLQLHDVFLKSEYVQGNKALKKLVQQHILDEINAYRQNSISPIQNPQAQVPGINPETGVNQGVQNDGGAAIQGNKAVEMNPQLQKDTVNTSGLPNSVKTPQSINDFANQAAGTGNPPNRQAPRP